MKKTKKQICGGGDNPVKTKVNAILLAMPEPYDKTKPNEEPSPTYIQYLLNIVNANPDNMKHIDEMVYLLKQHGYNKPIPTKIKEIYEVNVE